MLTDPDCDSDFHRDGYVTIPVLSPNEMTYLLAEAAKLRPDGDFEPPAGAPIHFSVSDTSALYKREVQELLRRVFEPHVRRLLVDFRFLHGIFVVKPPGSRGLDLHADWSVTADRTDVTAMIWCPLTDVGSHTIGVVESSHRLVPNIEIPNTPSYCTEFVDLLRSRSTQVAISSGEAVIFDSSLLHCSVPNASRHPRIALQATCIPVDATPTFFFKTNATQFEMILSESDFWVEENMHDVDSRRPHWQSLGFIESPNRPISAHEFMTRLDKGERGPLWHAEPSSAWPGMSIGRRARRRWARLARSDREG